MSLDPLLIDLAAQRDLSGTVTESAVAQAIDHRVAGLLWTRLSRGEADAADPVRARLESLDLESWARSRMLQVALDSLLDAARETGVRLALIKGMATAQRWYERPVERWAYDLDVVVHPHDVSGIDDLVGAVYPQHPLAGRLAALARGGHIQSVDFGVKDMPVDLHLDPIKLELVRSRSAEVYWRDLTTVELGGADVATFAPDVALFLHLVQLNKDNFRRLIGYADVVRGAGASDVDWSGVIELAAHEGVVEHVMETAREVQRELGVHFDLPSSPDGFRTRVWRRVWTEDTRLAGDRPGVHRHRLFVLPLTAKGRFWPSLLGWLRRLFPPRPLLDLYYPAVNGVYPIKLLRARLTRGRARSNQARI